MRVPVVMAALVDRGNLAKVLNDGSSSRMKLVIIVRSPPKSSGVNATRVILMGKLRAKTAR